MKMREIATRARKAAVDFHSDQSGEGPVGGILMLVGAAVIIVGLIWLANGGLERIGQFIDDLFPDDTPDPYKG